MKKDLKVECLYTQWFKKGENISRMEISKGRRRIMSIEKLTVKEFAVKESDEQMDVGDTYSYFVDDYGKVYRPKEGFTVTGEKLMDLFEEIGELDKK